MLIALRHEMHGTHIAYSDLEAKECEKNGWKRDEELSEKLSGIKFEKPAQTLAQQYEAKFGKKPHHKMLPANIHAALDGG